MRILVAAGGSGGHVFPALAVLEELHREGIHTLGWIGRPEGLEARIAKNRPWIEFLPLKTYGLPRDRPWTWPVALAKNFRALAQARRLVWAFSPDVVLAMGGYPAVAPALAAKSLGIPVVLHEQNAVMGLANRFLARFADFVLLGFPNTSGCPTGAKTVYTGTPVRREFTEIPETLGDELLVLGGSLGSRALVDGVLEAAPALAKLFDISLRLVVGRAGDPATIEKKLRSVGLKASVHPFTEGLAELLAQARLVLSRAGGSTLAELTCAGRPAVLVPWNGAANAHQKKNAAFFQQKGACVLLQDRDLRSPKFSSLISQLWRNEKTLVRLGAAARAWARPDATKKVAEIVKSVGRGK
ncbi:undecaprenyldiphospho-muramoylpentapeptide beta-N-acetylglucosaminyltransferase [Candidatus Bipolaricaulota bacterium]|nr:undecaprenyldiphospho-muramoylpentapeptide beta-N-acetylglucosaminyltransferase [Candidatus Bipolaricaulota bacterium]